MWTISSAPKELLKTTPNPDLNFECPKGAAQDNADDEGDDGYPRSAYGALAWSLPTLQQSGSSEDRYLLLRDELHFVRQHATPFGPVAS